MQPSARRADLSSSQKPILQWCSFLIALPSFHSNGVSFTDLYDNGFSFACFKTLYKWNQTFTLLYHVLLIKKIWEIQAVACCSTACMCITLFHLMDRHSIVNVLVVSIQSYYNAVVNITVHLFWYKCAPVYFGCHLGVQVLCGTKYICSFNCISNGGT